VRVLFVNQTAQVSGAEHSLLSLLKGLGDEVERLVACPPGELAEQVAALGVEHLPITGTQVSFRLHPLHTSSGLLEIGRSALQVRRAAARRQVDLIHANTTRASLLALLARRRAAPPVVAHIRDRAVAGRLSRQVFRLIGSRADAVVANSAYVAEQFEGMSLRRPVEVVHNPVDLARFDPAQADGGGVRRELGIGPETAVLSVIGQLTELKGQDVAIRATARLAAAGLDVVLLVVGSAKFAAAGTQLDNVGYGRRLPELTAELGAADAVRFLGERGDIASILAATDLMLMPSRREAFGRVAIEAMAMGVPVVAGDVGGPTEIVRSGVDGLLLPVEDVERWAGEIERLLREPRLRAELGRKASERAQAFSLRRHAAAIEALYGRLLAA
jgi:L-malate glycosyltransferase